MEIRKVNLQAEADQLKEFWKLRKVADVNDHVLNITKIKGEFEMHAHENGEKIFYVLDGTMYVEFINGDITEVNKGELIVIPKGTQQKPFAKEETTILFIESK